MLSVAEIIKWSIEDTWIAKKKKKKTFSFNE